MKLQNLQVGQSYLVKDCLTQDDIRKHLANLGLKVGEEIRIISKTKTNAIFQVKASRLALDREIIESLVLIEKSATEIINLSEAPIGSSVRVMDIYATGALRRRLMDMGLTKNTQLFLKKVAPLGDPIEITLRGYELTLRKSEAQMIGVQITSEVRK
ncbi:ferrous iron transport protein A [Streptococcus suis]|uniref:Ferrous iron transport protein A n=2 Tax=Streptococcus suis TaxID=1307 RepID=A0A4T2GVG1_STRSU|nr:ferrous iron transport protein A [Streptococcus suis]EHC01896.1 FeoA family protein [Streptococcus suis R61]MBY4965905.1 ferrous iron transport protein A [Streptococcus suis]MBY5014276.1 ferrous iron transport protein A [Streptococcus suis]MBY5029562.1 ferrous iron transport protein A [Streptococcus suis]MCL4935593.1 ferrous iron transport protein A [Streptococcus suis]